MCPPYAHRALSSVLKPDLSVMVRPSGNLSASIIRLFPTYICQASDFTLLAIFTLGPSAPNWLCRALQRIDILGVFLLTFDIYSSYFPSLALLITSLYASPETWCIIHLWFPNPRQTWLRFLSCLMNNVTESYNCPERPTKDNSVQSIYSKHSNYYTLTNTVMGIDSFDGSCFTLALKDYKLPGRITEANGVV